MKISKPTKTLIVGHKIPDTDSLAAAYALAAFKTGMGYAHIEAICAGLPGERSEYIFNKFGAVLPRTVHDVYPRARDICIPEAPVIYEDQTLLEGIYLLNENQMSRLAIINQHREYCGMFSLFRLIGERFQLNPLNESIDLVNRKIFSSISLINKTIRGRILTPFNVDILQEFNSYVATMRHEHVQSVIAKDNPDSLILIVGDRENVLRTAIDMQVRLLIIVGGYKVSEELLQAAKENHVTVITSSLDATSILQNIKFSSPVGLYSEVTDFYQPDERLCDIRPVIMSRPEEILPVVDEHRKYLGIIRKGDIDRATPFNLILVDHNEFDQAVKGVEEVPIIEIVDHHRFGLPQTDHPIKITCDTVGSTCTLITEMFQQAQCALTKDVAGVLLGGIITDTILLRSPTTTPRDRKALYYLEEIAEVNSETFAEEIYQIGSLISKLAAPEVLRADKKIFTCGKLVMEVAQVEEVSFIEFENKKTQLVQAAQTLMKQDGCQFFALLITNVTTENSLLLAVGTADLLRLLPFRKIEDNIYDLPGVLSRKKQLIPQLMKAFAILH